MVSQRSLKAGRRKSAHFESLESFLFACLADLCLPVDESVLFLSLLEEVHEFALMVCQVGDISSATVGSWALLIRCQPLVGIHNLETHLSESILDFFSK